MSMYNKQLKPLNHKRAPNQSQPSIKGQPLGRESARGLVQKPSNEAKKPNIEAAFKAVKLKKGGERSTKTIEHYDCDDMECELEDNNYFEVQLERNIKTEMMSRTNKPQNKANIVLPKLESEMKTRNMKDIEREMDMEM